MSYRYKYSISVLKTPQAVDDTAIVGEDSWVVIDVLANDLGGLAKSLYSIYQSELTQATQEGDVVSLASGSTIWIDGGAIVYNAGSSFGDLNAGESLIDTFQYSIQLSNGTLSIAKVDVTILGADDEPLLPSFSRTDYQVGNGPQMLAVGDVNGDGFADILTANNYAASISILLNDGNGGFTRQADLALPAGPHSLQLGDLNGDGSLDIVTGGGATRTVEVLLGNGDGTFQSAVHYAAQSDPNQFAIADFNGDGFLDVAADAPGTSLGIYLGNGDGTLQNERFVAVDHEFNELKAGDFDEDGNLDLVVINNQHQSISVLIGNGDATFQSPVTYEGVPGSTVSIGDLNEDGHLDIVAGDLETTIFLGNGDGTFVEDQILTGLGYRHIIRDVNNDGHVDLTYLETNNALVRLGDGTGSFGDPIAFAVASPAVGFASGDFNNDGWIDFASTNMDSSDVVSVLLNTTFDLSM